MAAKYREKMRAEAEGTPIEEEIDAPSALDEEELALAAAEE